MSVPLGWWSCDRSHGVVGGQCERSDLCPTRRKGPHMLQQRNILRSDLAGGVCICKHVSFSALSMCCTPIKQSKASQFPLSQPGGAVLLRAQGPRLTTGGRAWRTAASLGASAILHPLPWPGTRLHTTSSGLSHSTLRCPEGIAQLHPPNKPSITLAVPVYLPAPSRSREDKAYSRPPCTSC